MDDSIDHIASRLVVTLQDAWNSGDARAFADAFAADADFIHILGGHGRGRDSIARAHEALFAGIYRGSRVRFDLASVRSLGADAFVALLVQTLEFEGRHGSQSMTCRPSLVVVRDGRGWAIALMQNTRTAEAAPDGLSDHPFAPRRTLETTS